MGILNEEVDSDFSRGIVQENYWFTRYIQIVDILIQDIVGQYLNLKFRNLDRSETVNISDHELVNMFSNFAQRFFMLYSDLTECPFNLWKEANDYVWFTVDRNDYTTVSTKTEPDGERMLLKATHIADCMFSFGSYLRRILNDHSGK